MPIGNEYSEKPFGLCRRCWNSHSFRLWLIGAYVAILWFFAGFVPLATLLGESDCGEFLRSIHSPFILVTEWADEEFAKIIVLLACLAAFGGIMANGIDLVIRKSRLAIAGRGRSIQSISHARATVTGQVANSATSILHKPFVEFVLRCWAIGTLVGFASCILYLVKIIFFDFGSDVPFIFYPLFLPAILGLLTVYGYEYLGNVDVVGHELLGGVFTGAMLIGLAAAVFCCTYGTILALLVRGIWRKFFAHRVKSTNSSAVGE